jgi:hypothetical protein
MGLFGFLRRHDRSAMPEPGSPEFRRQVEGSALPGSAEMGQSGWVELGPGGAGGARRVELGDGGARERVLKVLRRHGIDPDRRGQVIDASGTPGLREEILAALGTNRVRIPEAGGSGGFVGTPAPPDRLAQIEHLAAKRDAGEITEAEFQAQKALLLG